ncbi:chordin-like [Corticium candelabrum]|uniref:chordin-like n=1 Tax=Corticium candelabrum TaxID=121492 RepID=UPI002E257C70|nr:chordin-like [Corticium candelabrum]
MSISVAFFCCFLTTSYALPTTDDLLTIEDPTLFDSETHSHSTRTGCWVENTQYRVGDKWHPTLQPFGVFYCINCTCKETPHNATAVLSCENVEDDCPQLDCRYQYKPKQQCCQQCLDVDDDSEVPTGSNVIVVDPANPHLFRGEYLSLLTGSQGHPPVKTFAAGFAQFVVTLSTVHYLFEFHGIGEIISIQIVTADDEVAYKVPINMHGHRICGVWSDVDSRLLDLLLDSALFVIVRTTQFSNGELFGDIFYKENEWIDSFMSVMKPHFVQGVSNTVDGRGGGGLGMFRLNPSQRTLEFVITFDGINDIEGAYFYTKMNIEQQHKHHNHTQHLHNFTSTYKPKAQIFVGAWSHLNDTELEWLARGHLHMRIYGQREELRGQLVVARTCGGLSAVLSGRQPPLRLSTGAGASGLFELSEDGSLSFEINWVGLEGQITNIAFYELLRHEDHSQRLELIYNFTDSIKNTDIKVNGVWNHLSASHLALLTDGHLHIMICTERHKDGEVTGQVQRLLFNSHEKIKKDLSVTLTGSQVVPFQHTGVAGQVWFSLDCFCSLHYRTAVQGLSSIDYVTNAQIRGPATEGRNGPVVYSILDSFSRNLGVGLIRYPDTHFYNMIRQGFLYIEIETKQSKIRGQLKLGTNCSKSSYDIFRPKKEEDFRDCGQFKHSDRWHPSTPGKTDYCIHCSCQDGLVLCIPWHCQNLTCLDVVVLDGHCCPVCLGDDEDLFNSSSGSGSPNSGSYSDIIGSGGFGGGDGFVGLGSSRSTELSQTGCPTDLHQEGCQFGGYLYPHGLKWHPYLSQSGVMKCVICQCIQKETRAEVQCNPKPCPTLECAEPIFLDENDCCPSCPVVVDDPTTPTPAIKSCTFGQQEYNEGATFIPYHPLVGLMECVRCNCTDGKVSCAWPCPKHFQCDNPIKRPGDCCQSCPDEFHATSGPDISQ